MAGILEPMNHYEKLGLFYLGRAAGADEGEAERSLLLYESKDLLTHAVCVGMTGSGKTGLCIGLIEEAAIDGIPAIVVDPKGDLGNLLLTFPELRPEDFLPWVNREEARQQGLSLEEFAENQASLWEKGLAKWGQSGERIGRLRESADFAIFTPGSEAGLPISVLDSFKAPSSSDWEDADLIRDRIESTVTGLLSLLGIDADPIQSPEHILLSTLLEHLWQAGADVGLADLIQGVQVPPFDRVGAFDLEAFYSTSKRTALAIKLNNLLAAPSFQSWLEGTPLDLEELLYTEEGRPRVAVFSIAHLSDQQRMFFVTLLLNETLSWIRRRPGTNSLRALLYMDEIFGYLPPVAEPPSKKPLLTLLKQARAYGLGVVLATQNPGDLDYKGLANIGTWFLGRLQAERDKEKVLEGLKGVTVEGGPSRKELDRLLTGLKKRTFLLHNVNEDGPELFETRWVMSYLRGPLTRDQIRTLMADRKAVEPSMEAAKVEGAQPAEEHGERAGIESVQEPPAVAATSTEELPVVDSNVAQYFHQKSSTAQESVHYEPFLLGVGKVDFVDRKTREILASDEVELILPLNRDEIEVDWSEAEAFDVGVESLGREPSIDATWASLPEVAKRSSSYTQWKRDLEEYLYSERRLEMFESAALKARSHPRESERDFRIRLGDLARSERDRRLAALRDSFAARRRKLEDRLVRAESRLAKEKDQATRAKLETAVSIGSTLLSVLTGRRRLSQSTINRAGSSVREAQESSRQAEDVREARQSIETLENELQELEQDLARQVEEMGRDLDPLHAVLVTVTIQPRRSDVDVRSTGLLWLSD